MSSNYEGPYNFWSACRARWILEIHTKKQNVFFEKFDIKKLKLNEIVEKLSKFTHKEVGYTTCIHLDDDHAILHNNNLFIHLEGNDGSPVVVMETNYTNQQNFDKIKSLFSNNISHNTLSWYFRGSHGFEKREMELQSINIVKDSHYPFIEGGIDKFIDSYLNSSASVLILMGEPGTGKTSFIRHMMKNNDLNATLSYDKRILESDSFYTDFLFDHKKDLLILEDSDLILHSREDSENTIMSKLLNVSDGLVKIDFKKIIFSTNITQLSKIDSAIIRPGRCFDVLTFRKLSYEEANIIREEHGMPPLTKHREYTLAEIFNDGHLSSKPQKIGII